MITNHTRVECRVLCALARGGDVREIRPGVFATDKIDGVRVVFSEDLRDRLLDKGYITAAGKISKAGREYVAEVRARAGLVVATEGDDDAMLDTLAETGFQRPGLGAKACCESAARILDVIQRLSPQES